jgi:hypothetical protein
LNIFPKNSGRNMLRYDERLAADLGSYARKGSSGHSSVVRTIYWFYVHLLI